MNNILEKTMLKFSTSQKMQNENLRTDFINKVKKYLSIKLEERDVVAIHRLPSMDHSQW